MLVCYGRLLLVACLGGLIVLHYLFCFFLCWFVGLICLSFYSLCFFVVCVLHCCGCDFSCLQVSLFGWVMVLCLRLYLYLCVCVRLLFAFTGETLFVCGLVVCSCLNIGLICGVCCCMYLLLVVILFMLVFIMLCGVLVWLVGCLVCCYV